MNSRFKAWRHNLAWTLPMVALLAGCTGGDNKQPKTHALATYSSATWEALAGRVRQRPGGRFRFVAQRLHPTQGRPGLGRYLRGGRQRAANRRRYPRLSQAEPRRLSACVPPMTTPTA